MAENDWVPLNIRCTFVSRFTSSSNIVAVFICGVALLIQRATHLTILHVGLSGASRILGELWECVGMVAMMPLLDGRPTYAADCFQKLGEGRRGDQNRIINSFGEFHRFSCVARFVWKCSLKESEEYYVEISSNNGFWQMIVSTRWKLFTKTKQHCCVVVFWKTNLLLYWCLLVWILRLVFRF